MTNDHEVGRARRPPFGRRTAVAATLAGVALLALVVARQVGTTSADPDGVAQASASADPDGVAEESATPIVRVPATPAQASSEPSDPASPRAPTAPSPSRSSTATPASPLVVKESVPIGESADAGEGIVLTVPRVRTVEANGAGGIGDLAGPAIAVSLRVTNASGEPMPLNEVVVTANFGADDTPAPPVVNDTRNSRLTGRLGARASAKGTYVFSLPESGRDDVTIRVSYAGGAPNVAFTGDVS